MDKNNPQKEFINKLQKVAITPLLCSNSFLNSATQTYVPGKRFALNKYLLTDYLTVASNQVVFELDAKSFASNYEIAKKIISVLKLYELPYYIYSSGGKGLHIELWFNHINFKADQNKKLYSEALSFGFSYKHIRLWFWNKILDEAGISPELRGTGKIIDSSCLTFDDIAGKSKLLRVAGGRKVVINKETQETITAYKTYISEEEFNKRHIKLTNFNQVRYPAEIQTFNIDEAELCSYISQYIEKAKAMDLEATKNIDLGEKGYINLESVKRIREGLPSGQRALGAQILSIAMACDKLPLNLQESILNEYVDNCEQIGSAFTFEEAKGWLNWVQRQEEVFWNCSLTKEANLHDDYMCEYCMKKHKKELKFLSESKVLDKIKEVLDYEIVGENDIKILMFLLMLSKDFPSKTGSPRWNIKGDPMSQNIILSSDSSSGKSWITKKLLELFGEKDQDYFVVSRYTKSALNYYTEINMDGKIIFLEELQGLDENTAQLRVWMSEGELSLSTVEKAIGEDSIERNVLVQKSTIGQPVFITNQAEGKVEDQLNNRSWVISLDTSDNQTAKILDYQDDLNKNKNKSNLIEKRLIKDALKQLKPYHFIIPFADWKALNIPISDVRARRDYQKFLTLIKCSAYLHQKQRPILVDEYDNEFILCLYEDYEIALKYSSGILGATFSGLTVQQIELINYLKSCTFAQEFTIAHLMQSLNKSQPYWYGQLSQLEDLGYISSEKSIGKATNYSLVFDKVINIIKLPDSNKLPPINIDDLLQEFPKTNLSQKNLEKIRNRCNRSGEKTCNRLGQKTEGLPHKNKKEPIMESLENKENLQEPIIKTQVHKRQNFQYINENSHTERNISPSGSIIGSCNRLPDNKAIVEFIKNADEMLVERQKICEHFGKENEERTNKILTWLCQTGFIMEAKKNKFIIN